MVRETGRRPMYRAVSTTWARAASAAMAIVYVPFAAVTAPKLS
jgi:hypothetical protein